MRVGRRWGGWMRERAAVCADCGASFSAKRCAAGHERRHGGRFRSPLHGLPPLRLSFHGEQAMFFCRAGAGLVPNGGRRTDGCLRRPRPPGADGRRVALSVRHSIYIMCLAPRRRFPLRIIQRKAPTGDQTVGGGGFVVGVRRHGGRRFLAFAAALTALFLGVEGGAGRFFDGGYGLCARGGGRFGSGGGLFG